MCQWCFLSKHIPVSVHFLFFIHNMADNRMMRRAFGHNLSCDNQSSNVVLRGKIYLILSNIKILACSVYTTKGASSWHLWFVVSHVQMIQSLLEEHGHAMMLKHHPTNNVLRSISQYFWAVGPLLCFLFCFSRWEWRGDSQVCRFCMENDSWTGDFLSFLKHTPKILTNLWCCLTSKLHLTVLVFMFFFRWCGAST